MKLKSSTEKFFENNSKDLNAGLRLANVLNEKGENKAAIDLIDSFILEEKPFRARNVNEVKIILVL